MFKIELKTDNAAFEGDPAQEVIWALQQVCQALRAGRVIGNCCDTNGNKVGSWELVADQG